MNDVNITFVCLNNKIKSINPMTFQSFSWCKVLTDSLNHKTKHTEQISYHNKNIGDLW